MHEIVNLPLGFLDDNLRIDQTSGSNDLFNTIGLAELVWSWRGGHIDGLANPFQEFIPLQRTVVQCGG